MTIFFTSCARNWINYPPHIVDDGRGGQRVISSRAVEFNGSDLIGGTTIGVSHSGVRVAADGGINNSVSTAEGYRTVRYGTGAIAIISGLGIVTHAAQVAYGANQAQVATTNAARAAAVKPAPLPAAGSTINAITPATVVPVQ
jgi:hypothetical protein